MTRPISLTATWGDNLMVVPFTTGAIVGPIVLRRPVFSGQWTGKDRSRMMQSHLLVCGMATAGKIFSALGGSCCSSSHRTISAKPDSAWYAMFWWNSAMVARVIAVRCGPWATALRITSIIQSGPQSTGTPCSQSLRIFPNGCARTANADGCIRLRVRVLHCAFQVGV